MRYTMGSNVVKSGKKKKWGKYEKIVFYDPFNLILVKEMKMRLLEKNNSGKISGTSSGCAVSFSVSVCFLSSSLTVSLVVPAAVVLLVLVGRV